MALNLLKQLRQNRPIAAFVLATIMLHVFAWHWVDSLPSQTAGAKMKESKVQVSLLRINQLRPELDTTPPPEKNLVPAKIAKVDKKPAPVAPPAPTTPPPAQPKPGDIADGSQDNAVIVAASGYLAVTPAPKKDELTATASTAVAPSPTPPAEPVAANTTAASNTAQSGSNEPAQFKISPPPSAVLALQLIRTEVDRNPFYGVGEINWRVSNDTYSMSVNAGLDLLITSINLLKIKSEGKITEGGIAPVISSETRRNRSETAIHFNYENKQVSFSSSNKSLPMADGAQDKASVLMQLAGIGYADAAQFRAGQEIAIQVAEERDATVFQFIVVGQEELKNKLGTLTTWHVVRPPRAGAYNSQLDIWFAPDKNWYPVQVRNTESNGAVTTQIVTKITPQLQ